MIGIMRSEASIARLKCRRAARKQEKLAKKQAKKEAAEKRLQEKIDMRGYCIRWLRCVAVIGRSHSGCDDDSTHRNDNHPVGVGVDSSHLLLRVAPFR